MSGDCKQQPIIFQCPVLTPTKVALLQLHGVSVEIPELNYETSKSPTKRTRSTTPIQ